MKYYLLLGALMIAWRNSKENWINKTENIQETEALIAEVEVESGTDRGLCPDRVLFHLQNHGLVLLPEAQPELPVPDLEHLFPADPERDHFRYQGPGHGPKSVLIQGLDLAPELDLGLDPGREMNPGCDVEVLRGTELVLHAIIEHDQGHFHQNITVGLLIEADLIHQNTITINHYHSLEEVDPLINLNTVILNLFCRFQL